MKSRSSLYYVKLLVSITVSVYIWIPGIYAQIQKPSPQSPNAAALSRSLDYPASNSTGVPAINIPLFKVEAGQLNYTAELNYHSSGVRLGELATWVGVSWSMAAAPEITRTISGGDDLVGSNGYLKNTGVGEYNESKPVPYATYLKWMDDGLKDEQPDEFHYNLMNKSGKFLYQKYDDQTNQAVPVPYEQLDIQFHSSSNSFTLVDNDGTKYEFGGSGYTERNYMSGGMESTTAWKCTAIISANKKDTITFEYYSTKTRLRGSYNEKVEIYDGGSGAIGGMLCPIPYDGSLLSPEVQSLNPDITQNPVTMIVTSGSPRAFINTYFLFGQQGAVYNFNQPNIIFDTAQYPPEGYGNVQIMETKILKRINFRGGNIDFHVQDDGTEQWLDLVSIFNYKNELIKRIELDVTTKQLGGLKFKGTNDLQTETYKFDYNNYNGYNSDANYPTDAWGYGNSLNNSEITDYLDIFDGSNIPHQWIQTWGGHDYKFPIGRGSLESNEEDMKTGILKRITYPGGGYTEFEFEANRYLQYSVNEKLAGGLRIKNIKNYTAENTSPATEKYYKYGYTENGIGMEINDPLMDNFEYEQNVYYQVPRGGPGQPWRLPNYPNARKRTFVKSSVDNNVYSNGAPVNYSFVTVYEKESGIEKGKTTYSYNLHHSNFRYSGTYLTEHQLDIDNGLLLGETQYAYYNGNYEWVRNKVYNYETHLLPNRIHVGKVFNSFLLMGDIPESVNGMPVNEALSNYMSNFRYISYGLKVGYNRLISETDSTREVTNLARIRGSKKNYYYDNPNHTSPTRIESTNSKGETISSYTTYPQDYALDNGMIGSLISNHKLSYPIEVITSKKRGQEGDIISGTINAYTPGAENYYAATSVLEPVSPISLPAFRFSNSTAGQWPESVTDQVLEFDPKYKLKATADIYDDRGNICQTTTFGRRTDSFKWGYKNQYLIASIKNAALNEVFFENFEDGEADFESNLLRVNSKAHTGHYSALLTNTGANEVVSHSSKYLTVNSGVPHLVTYSGWIYSDGPSAQLFLFMYRAGETNYFTYVDAVECNQIGKWTYVKKDFLVPADVVTMRMRVDNNEAGNIWFDDLSIYPSDAQMNTYTYDPLVGMSSETDPKGKTIYYEYDGMQRLIKLKDQNGNIIKNIDYHYKNSLE